VGANIVIGSAKIRSADQLYWDIPRPIRGGGVGWARVVPGRNIAVKGRVQGKAPDALLDDGIGAAAAAAESHELHILADSWAADAERVAFLFLIFAAWAADWAEQARVQDSGQLARKHIRRNVPDAELRLNGRHAAGQLAADCLALAPWAGLTH